MPAVLIAYRLGSSLLIVAIYAVEAVLCITMMVVRARRQEAAIARWESAMLASAIREGTV
jgi:hypothetical protein